MLMMEFSDWITKKYLIWRGDRIGNSASIAEFAKSLGASQQIVSEWMKPNGRIPKSKKYTDALIRAYGDEAYEVLGLPRPELSPVPWSNLPDDFRRRAESAMTEASNAIAASGHDPESPEAKKILDEVMGRWGFTPTSSESEG